MSLNFLNVDRNGAQLTKPTLKIFLKVESPKKRDPIIHIVNWLIQYKMFLVARAP